MDNRTSKQFDGAIGLCSELFFKKMKDYGTAWRMLRTPSLTDQIYIKASRIRSIDSKGEQKIEEGIQPEFIGIVNYSTIALIQLELGEEINLTNSFDELDMDPKTVETLYIKYAENAKNLMQDKNHDYGEAWRNMRISSLTDIILMKLFRIKQIEDNKGKTLVSEGVDANYYDIINYAVFALIKLMELKK
jgi:Nucleotide modification associated domain 1